MSVHAREHCPLSLILAHYFFPLFLSLAHTPTHRDRHINPPQKTPVVFSISPSQKQTEKHKDAQTEKHSYLLLHEHAHTRSPYYPCGCHQKQPLCPTLQYVKVAACFYSPWSSLFLPLTPHLLCVAFQSSHVIPPLRHLSYHPTVKCICRPSQIGCHIYFKGISKHIQTD